MSDSQFLNPFTYLIIYKNNSPAGSGSSKSLVSNTKPSPADKKELGKHIHLWDSNLTAILPAVNYILHMPRYVLDLVNFADRSAKGVNSYYPMPHLIDFIPEEIILSSGSFKTINPTLIFYTEDCAPETIEIISTIPSTLGAVSIGRLNNNLLNVYWRKLYKISIGKNASSLTNFPLKVLCGTDRKELPALFARPGAVDNVIISLPGISSAQVKYGNLNSDIPVTEQEGIELISLHHAISKREFLIELPNSADKLLAMFNELEINYKNGTNNNYVLRTLKKLGDTFQKMLTPEQLLCIENAKHITVLSNFPIGLSIINGSETPLQCRMPISYIPLTPLTRCFEYEMRPHLLKNIGKKCKVIYAECVPNDKENRFIFAQCQALLSALKKLEEDTVGAFEVCYEEIKNVKDLRQFISDNSDADILHISAHGSYKPEKNEAFLNIGNEEWLADEFEEIIPPVVILSACHISPRGRGVVNAADCFLHNGAEAVLGTFIPVDANRNSILLARMYTYIAETLNGKKRFDSLAELWSFIVATNAIHEIIRGNENLFKWMYSPNDKGIMRISQFYELSQNKINSTTVYEDSIKILKKMLADEGLGNKYDQILNQKDYFQESYFYQWIGMPENIRFAEKF